MMRFCLAMTACLALSSVALAHHKGKPHGKPGGGGVPPPNPPALEYSIQFLSLGGDSSRASDLNSLGQVVGSGRNAAGDPAVFRYDSTTGTISDLNDLLGPSPWEIASGGTGLSINDAGQVAAIGTTDWVVGHAVRVMLDSGGGEATVEVISDSSATNISLQDINNHGDLTGHYTSAAGERRGFVHIVSTGLTDIGTLGGTRTEGGALNDAGQITGYSFTDDGARHAFRYTPTGAMEDLGTLSRKGGSQFESWGFDINAGGAVVGQADDKNVAGLIRYRAFVAPPGEEMTDLGVLAEGNYSRAHGINDAGWIVGASQIDASKFGGRLAGDFHAFLWTDDFGMVRLEDFVVDMPATFDGRLEQALVINDAGQIAGDAVWGDGRTVAFLLTPVTSATATAVPEPSTWLLCCVAIALLRLRRNQTIDCVADGHL